KRRIPSVLAENPGSNTHPKVAEVASPLLSSISDAKSKPAPKSKIARKCTAFLRLQTPNSPTRFREDPLLKRSSADPQAPAHNRYRWSFNLKTLMEPIPAPRIARLRKRLAFFRIESRTSHLARNSIRKLFGIKGQHP